MSSSDELFSAEQVVESRRITDAATKPPWKAISEEQWEAGIPFFDGPEGAFLFPVGLEEHDLAFVDHARTAHPQALDALEAAWRERDEARDLLSLAVGRSEQTLAVLVRTLQDEVKRLRAIVDKLPHKDDIETALMANNMGGLKFKEDYCQCDPSVGMSPCPYCAIHSVLTRMLKAVRPSEAATATKEEPDT
jgi:hypothetical protein